MHNRRVREEFSDIEDDDFIGTSRGSLKVACLIKDEDSANMTIHRLWLFYVILGQASAMHPPLYTMPIDRYQQQIKFAPQCTLYFREDLDDVEEGYAPIDAEISFRLKRETNDSLSQSDVAELARKIKAEFATGSGYRWKKGRTKLNYRDLDKGYLLSINAFSEAEGKGVIQKVLSVQGDTMDLSNLSVSEMGESPPIVPPTDQILGKVRRLPRKRPIGFVRFIYADLHVRGIPEAICLIDRSRRRKSPVVQA